MKDFLPVIYSDIGTRYQASDQEESLYNAVPWILDNQEIGACPRHEFTKIVAFTASSADDRGRGLVTYGGEFELYCDQDTYYYQGGSQDMTATTGNGHAGNTGFNEEFTASFIRHKISGVENLVIVNAGHASIHASATHGCVWTAASGIVAPTSISDANMPGNNGVSLIRGGASLDGYFFVGDINGQIHNSNLNDITTWTETHFITAEREPDIGVYIGKHHDHVVYIGTRSIEFFYNAGNSTGSPLVRRSDVSYNIGCYFPNTIVEIGDVLYFVGVEHGGWPRIYKLENFQLTAISNPKLEELMRLSASGTYPDITELDSLHHYFWMSYVTVSDSPGLIITYDFYFTYHWHEKANVWSRWAWDDNVTYPGGQTGGNWSNVFPIMSFNGSSGGGSLSRYQFINGNMGIEANLDNDTIDDLGSSNTPTVFMKFPRWDAGTDQKKRINYIRVITAPASTTSSVADPMNVDLRWFDFDRTASTPVPPNSYTTARTVDLNVRGARVARCGKTRERAFILDWPLGHGPTSIVKGLEIDYEVVGE